MKIKYPLIILLALYALFIIPYSSHLANRPVAQKLGYVPDAKFLNAVTGDQRYLVAEWTVLKVLFYYGSLFEKSETTVPLAPDYQNMSRLLATAVKMDPYNMDAYYFTQATFVWEVRGARDVNKVLAYGMKYRTWDYWLPFYAGFNSAYFLKDYKAAAGYMSKAAEISGESLFTNLAARYFYEAGEVDFGILFIKSMEDNATDPRVKKLYETRKQALLAVKEINTALTTYRMRYKRPPRDLSQLVATGILEQLPKDPYGGTFFLNEKGGVESTSKFAFRRKNQ